VALSLRWRLLLRCLLFRSRLNWPSVWSNDSHTFAGTTSPTKYISTLTASWTHVKDSCTAFGEGGHMSPLNALGLHLIHNNITAVVSHSFELLCNTHAPPFEPSKAFQGGPCTSQWCSYQTLFHCSFTSLQGLHSIKKSFPVMVIFPVHFSVLPP